MKIREINAMRGPNYWSIRRHKLIVMVLDLEEMEEKPSNVIAVSYTHLDVYKRQVVYSTYLRPATLTVQQKLRKLLPML